MDPIYVKATSLSDAWFQLLYQCVEKGREFKIDQGSFEGQKRCEFDFVTVRITHPDALPLIPQVNPALGFPNPVEDDYLDKYLPYLMTGEEEPGEAYTYGQRICKTEVLQMLEDIEQELLIPEVIDPGDGKMIDPGLTDFYDGYNQSTFLSQMDLMIWTYKNKGHRNNQMTLQVGQPSDMLLKDPPCLRHIDTRIQDGKLHFFPYFRSWDLFGGLPANLAAIETMKQYCASEIGVGNGEILATSKGLHIYDYVFEIAEAIRGRSMSSFRKEAGFSADPDLLRSGSYGNHISRG